MSDISRGTHKKNYPSDGPSSERYKNSVSHVPQNKMKPTKFIADKIMKLFAFFVSTVSRTLNNTFSVKKKMLDYLKILSNCH
jgi:hypothetical protein